jgi:hypothetical protein
MLLLITSANIWNFSHTHIFSKRMKLLILCFLPILTKISGSGMSKVVSFACL